MPVYESITVEQALQRRDIRHSLQQYFRTLPFRILHSRGRAVDSYEPLLANDIHGTTVAHMQRESPIDAHSDLLD